MGVKRALVLGCGGVAGGAWTIAALNNLEKQLQWDAREADILIGTSAGAVVAALLSAGVSVEQLMACQRGDADSGCAWQHDKDTGGALPPMPRLRTTAGNLLWKGLKGEISLLTTLCGLAPTGQFDMTPFRNLIDGVIRAGEWTSHPDTWIMAVDTVTGQRVPFGKAGAPQAAMNDAVCASYGVPAWCPPVTIGGRDYIDGGVASPTSADMLAESDVEEVIVLAPMASLQMDNPRSPLARVERRVRRMMTGIVDKEVALLQAKGKRVLRLHPGPEDLEAIGYNMMDPARRTSVFNTALQTTVIQTTDRSILQPV